MEEILLQLFFVLDIMYKKRLHYAYARAYICVHLDEML